jgi:hypothetical protein
MGMGTNASTLGLMLAGAGSVMGATGAYRSAAGQKAALSYQASVADANANINEQQAEVALMNGQQTEAAQRLKTAAMLGDQKAAFAANGVDVNSGSPIEVMASTKGLGERDAFTIRDNAARMAWAYRERAKGFQGEASMDRATAGAMNPGMAAIGSLLSSAGTVADKWYRYRESTTGKADTSFWG